MVAIKPREDIAKSVGSSKDYSAAAARFAAFVWEEAGCGPVMQRFYQGPVGDPVAGWGWSYGFEKGTKMAEKKVLIVGVSGLVGFAAAKAFSADPSFGVVGISRRQPDGLPESIELVSVDLLDAAGAAATLSEMSDVTHVVYAALYEEPGLIAGWRSAEQMATNLEMLRNTLGPLLEAADVEHVSILQGTKAYGAHVEPMVVPGRERNPRHRHENFYWLQEDELRHRATERGFAWSVFRPVVIFGEAIGANMNPIPALGVYAAILRARGESLHWPGGVASITEAVDADLVGAALHWAATHDVARDQIFNVANGDVFSMRNVWPAIAESFGMEVGGDRPVQLATEMPALQSEWAELHDRFALSSPGDVTAFVGQSFIYTDMLCGYGNTRPRPPSLVSTIKLRQSGFGACMDTEDMLAKWIAHHQRTGLLPPREWV